MRSFRLLGLLALSLVAIPPLAAQKPSPRLGVLAGLNLAKLTGDQVDPFDDTRTGFLAGVFGEFNLSNAVAIEPQVLYAQKGGKGSEEGVDVTFKLDYIEIPLLLKYTFGAVDAGARPHLYLGPAVAFKMSCKFAGESEGVGLDFDCEDFSDFGEIKSTDFGGIVGAGVNIRDFLLGVRYELGFTKIAESVDTGTEDIKNSTISFYLGYAFRLK